MSSKTKNIGTIGEQILIAEFLKYNIPVLTPIGDNLPYDLVIIVKNCYLKIQVKTTEKIVDNKMIFSTSITNPYKKTNRKYTNTEIDYFGLYCIENGYIGLLPVSECTSKDTFIRLSLPKNNQVNKIKMYIDYEFKTQLSKLLTQ